MISDFKSQISYWALSLAVAFCASVALAQQNSGKDCAVCHLEWMEGFTKPGAATLMDRPPKPVVTESETCLGCHDGSVADSRKITWKEHGHKTGMAPPKDMKVPQQLPLEDGKLACRTCHTAHAQAGGSTLRDVVFLRVSNENGELCKSCHTDKSQGPQNGTHPLLAMKQEISPTLAAAGSHAGRDRKQIVCQTCHTAHGSKTDHLLVLGADNSELCVTCHEQMRGGQWRADGHEHPQNPPLRNDSQRLAIKQLGTRIGSDGTLICLSCHKVHNGQSGKAMLADTLQDSRLCIHCHEDRAAMAGTSHDLRKSAPGELNAKGMSSAQSGPCGACHTFHSYARQLTPRDGNPQGLCTTCHADGKVASKHTGQPFSHPSQIDPARMAGDAKLALYPSKEDPLKKSVACLSCHNPHETKRPNYLRTTGDDLCASCHSDKARSLAGAHDFAGQKVKNARGHEASESGKCGFCHTVHQAKGPAMWIATNSTPKDTDGLCIDCHRAGGMAEKHPAFSFNHPTASAHPTTRPAGDLPLFDAASHRVTDGVMSCATCHDPHASSKQSKDLLRSSDPTGLCIQCHPAQQKIASGPHDIRQGGKSWPAGMTAEGGLCVTCHRPHSNDPARQLWAAAPAAGQRGGDAVCVGCHTTNGFVAANATIHKGAMLHPAQVAQSILRGDIPGSLPLFPSAKSGTPDTMACRTCHDPHQVAPKYLLRGVMASESELCIACHADQRQIEKSMHGREYIDPQKTQQRACSPCHAAHAVEGSGRKLLWSAKYDQRGHTESEKLCLGCHSDGGGAKPPTMFRHPETAIKKLTDVTTQPTELQKKLAAIDQITCVTCHMGHGRELSERELAGRQPKAHVERAQADAAAGRGSANLRGVPRDRLDARVSVFPQSEEEGGGAEVD